MKPDALPGAEKYAKAHRREKRWYRVVTCLAAVVVFCTTYALILPAITLEKKCEIPEHTHTDACYTQVTTREKRNLICTVKADTVIHHHDSACYDENGNLWCTLPEIEAHAHTESCYAVPEADAPEVHTHTDDCYTVERSELTCTEHVHTDGCYRETSTLICGLEEGDGHQHGESCQNEAGEIVCGIEASEGHHHDGGCYEAHRERICGVDSDHQHTDQCYAQSKTLNCDLSTEPVEEAEPAEPVLVCEEPEVILHTHQPYEDEENPGCYDKDGNLICGKPQVVEHQHTDACFETVEEPVDTVTLTCTLPEDENHTHGPLCYGTWELSCGMEEHTHSDSCVSDEPEPDEPGVYTYQDDTLEAQVVLPEECDLPENAVLRVTALTEDSERYVGLADQAAEAAGGDVEQVLLYDIGFYAENEAGELQHLDVTDSATVSLLLRDAVLPETPGSVSVLHFAGDSQPPVRLENVTVTQQTPEAAPATFSLTRSSEATAETEAETMTVLTFDTEGFSVFAVVKVNSSQAVGEVTVTDDTIANIDGKSYVIVNYNKNRYMANETNVNGIAKKLLSDVTDQATLPQWTFTAVAETDGTTTYLIHCGGSYLKMDDRGNMSLATSGADATHFTVTADKGMVLAKSGNYYINNHGGGNTEYFNGYRTPDDDSHLRLYQRDGTTPAELAGQSFAIVNRVNGDYAMTAETFPAAGWTLGVPGLKAQRVTVTTGSDGVTYVGGAGVAEWTFHATETSGVYTISTQVNGTEQYLRFLAQLHNGNGSTKGSVTLDTAEKTRVTVTAVGDGKVLLQGAANGGYLNRAGEGTGFWAADNTKGNSQMYLCKKKADDGLIYNLNISGNWSNTPSIPATFQEITEETAFHLYTVENKSVAGTFAKKTTGRSDVISYYEKYNQALADAGKLTAETYRAPGAEYRFDGWQATVGTETYLFAENANATLQTDGIHIVDTTGVGRTLPSGTTLIGKWTKISDLVMFFVNTGDTMLETENDKRVTSTRNEYYVQVLATGHIYNPPTAPIVNKDGESELIHKENHGRILSTVVPAYKQNNEQTQIVIDAIKNNQSTLEPASVPNESALEEAVSKYLQEDTSRQIEFSGIPIVGSTITTDNYKLYWYKLTDNTGGDAWHIDGALVAKTQPMQVYKMFSGLTDEEAKNVYSKLNISVGLNVVKSDGSKEWANYITMNQASQAGIYTAHGKQDSANLYLWTLNASTAQGYTFTEENYKVEGYDHSSIISVHYKDGIKEFVQNTDTTYDSTNQVSKFPTRGIKGGDATSVIFANFYTPTGTGAFNITKQDPNGNRLANAVFTLTKKDQNGSDVPIATQTTNQNGSAYFSNLSAGTYTLRETTVPDGYEDPGKTWIVKVENANGMQGVSSVTIYDTDGSGNETGAGTRLFTRASDGTITMELNYVITNTPKTQTLTIIKHFNGITEEELQSISTNYSIQLTDSQNQVIATLKLSNGVLITGEMAYRWKVTGLNPNEKYTLTESNYSHTNYQDTVVTARISRNVETNGTTQTQSEDLPVSKETNTASIEVQKSNTADTVTLTNSYTNAFQLKLIKVSDDNEPLPGAKFYIYGSFDDASVNVPAGVANKITYTDGGKVNTAYYIGTIGETSSKGIAVFDGLKFTNTYVIVEAKAPDGYVKSDQPIVIKAVTQSVSYGNGVYTQTVTNTSKAQAKVTVTAEKTWTGQTLSSYPEVTLKLYQKKVGETAELVAASTLDGTTVDANTQNLITINRSGWTVTWSGLPYAYFDEGAVKPYTYYVAETPIAGFATSYNTEVKTLTVDSSSVSAALAAGTETVRSVTVTNTAGYELPDTGGAGTIPYTIGGFLLLTGAAFLLLYNHTKRSKEDSASS